MHLEDRKYASAGDLVEYGSCWSGNGRKHCEDDCCTMLAIVIGIYDDEEVPPAYQLMWSDGQIRKEWHDELNIVSRV